VSAFAEVDLHVGYRLVSIDALREDMATLTIFVTNKCVLFDV
jgi:hypothetical protein